MTGLEDFLMRKDSLLIVVGAFIFIFSSLIAVAGGVFMSPSNVTQPVEIVIPKGASLLEIAQELKSAGVIKDPFIFAVFVRLNGKDANLSAGRYIFVPAKATFASILAELRFGRGRKDAIVFRVAEGETNFEIFDRLAQFGFHVPAELDRAYEFSGEFPFLADLEDGVGLQGYLLPDTYIFTEAESARDVIYRMLKNFETKVPKVYQPDSRALYSLITLASLLEREIADSNERQIVAGILLKRLSAGIPLQVDATICYIKFLRRNPDCLPITSSDLALDNPYNTYKYTGFPPGPLSNPAVAAILSAATPENSPYLYYLSDPKTKRTIFSKTYEEHLEAKRRYLNTN